MGNKLLLYKLQEQIQKQNGVWWMMMNRVYFELCNIVNKT